MRWKRAIAPAITLVVLALLAAVAVPNLLKAKNRARQKRTMADMRTVASAWEARATDVNSYSIAGSTRDVTPADLARALEPKYVKKLPRTDGWGTEFQLSVGDYDDKGRAQTYTLRSLGSDARADPITDLNSGVTFSFTADIVYSNGSFVRYPEADG